MVFLEIPNVPLGMVFTETVTNVNGGFWQILLAKESRPLTSTSITRMGRCFFNKLAFSISSILKLFQKCMKKILERLKGKVCHMDDIGVWSRSDGTQQLNRKDSH